MSRANSSKQSGPRDKLPVWLWLLKHSQAFVTTGLTFGILYYHNAHVVYLTCTSLATSFIAKGLKVVLKQPRPPGSVVQTPGMPSTHSATGTFFALYLATLLARTPKALDPHWLEPIRPLLIPTLVTFPALMMYSRIRLGVHTTAQCLVGAAIGCTTTVLFSTLWYGAFAPTSFAASAVNHPALAPLVPQRGLQSTHAVREFDALIKRIVESVFAMHD